MILEEPHGAGMWGAAFSDCMTYRYHLWREFRMLDETPMKRINFLMLNPSTADHETNDPTVERCMRRAIDWGYDAMHVTNLFALRSTDPKALKSHADPIGPLNDAAIVGVGQKADIVIAAWGAHGSLNMRSGIVIEKCRRHSVELHALKVSKTGQPCHPLYLPYSLEPVPFRV